MDTPSVEEDVQKMVQRRLEYHIEQAAQCRSVLERLRGAAPQQEIKLTPAPSAAPRRTSSDAPGPQPRTQAPPKVFNPVVDSARALSAPDDTGDNIYDALRRAKWWMDQYNGATLVLPNGQKSEVKFTNTLVLLTDSINRWPNIKDCAVDALSAARMATQTSNPPTKFVLEKIDHGLKLLGHEVKQ